MSASKALPGMRGDGLLAGAGGFGLDSLKRFIDGVDAADAWRRERKYLAANVGWERRKTGGADI
jgi:hypothetical protein